MQKHASCKKATEKFKLLCLTYGMPREVRFDKGPQFSREFEEFLTDIKVEPTPSSAGNSSSNGLAESAVKSAKLLLRKCIEEKTSYAEKLCYFNQSPREDGYSPSELFHGQRVRSYLPTLDDTVDVGEGKAARERKDLITKCKKQSTNPLPPLKKGDMCYRIKLDGKKETLIHNPCEVVQIRNHGESYYVRDLETGRIYLRNRKFIKHSETLRNMEHRLKSSRTKHSSTSCRTGPCPQRQSFHRTAVYETETRKLQQKE